MSKRKSPGFHRLAGSYRADRHANGGLQFPPATGSPPRWLSKVAKAEWKRVAPFLLEQGLLTETDISVLAVYCNAFAGYLDCAKKVEQEGHTILVESQTRTGRTSKPIRNPAVTLMLDYQRAMLSAASKFGFSPYDRERIEGNADPIDTDPTLEDDDDDSDLYGPLNTPTFLGAKLATPQTDEETTNEQIRFANRA
jgi:P27 family predicted phage terminase small subunit